MRDEAIVMQSAERIAVIGDPKVDLPLLDQALLRFGADDGAAETIAQAMHQLQGRMTPMRVGGEVTAPVMIRRAELQWEQCTRGKKLRVSGMPILEAVIDVGGVPRDVRLIKGIEPCIDAAFVESIRQSRFKPGMYRGKPVPTIYNLMVQIDVR